MREFFQKDVKILLRQNGLILTILASATIIITGIAIVEDPSRWWVFLLGMLAVGAGVLLLINARTVVKAIVAVGLTLVESAYGFRLGATGDATGVGGTFWMMSTIALLFAMLSVSYIVPSIASRWNVITVMLIVHFMLVFSIGIATLNMVLSSIVSFFLCVILFVLLYRFAPKNLYKDEKMPIVQWDGETLNELYNEALQLGYGAQKIEKKHGSGLLVWNESYCFLLIPIVMSQSFGIGGGFKKSGLVYQGKNITPWLFRLVAYFTPTRRTRGANIMTVLLDTRGANGKDAKTIGVSLPDSKRKIPVGMLPAKDLINNYKKLLTKVFGNDFANFNQKLTEKQLYMLDTRLPERKFEKKSENSENL